MTNNPNPQLEDGYTRFANQILVDLCCYRLSGEEWQVLLCVFLKTYGYRKKEDWISLSQFHELTGMKKPSVIRAVKKLVSKNIVSKKANGKTCLYSYNKIKTTWNPLAKKLITPNNSEIVSKRANGVSNIANKSLQKSYPQKKQENDTKETIHSEAGKKEDINLEIITFFNEKFHASYQLTSGRSLKIRNRLATFTKQQILNAIEAMSKSPFHQGQNDRKWKANPDFILRSDEQIDNFLVQYQARHEKPTPTQPSLALLVEQAHKKL